MLEISSLQGGYGASQVLFDINLAIKEGEIVTLLGRNGMGKTTTIKTLMGLLPAKGGAITFEGRTLIGRPPERIARLGLGLVPEGRQIFPTLSVRENLLATASNYNKNPTPWTLKRIYTLFPRLEERAGQMAKTLSGGEQQMLAVSRALMINPRLLILDEATEGLAPVIRADIWRCIEELKAEGLSILIIDKTISVLKRLADHHVVLEKGKTVWSGDKAALERDHGIVHGLIGV